MINYLPTTRASKGAPLTHDEMDANFIIPLLAHQYYDSISGDIYRSYDIAKKVVSGEIVASENPTNIDGEEYDLFFFKTTDGLVKIDGQWYNNQSQYNPRFLELTQFNTIPSIKYIANDVIMIMWSYDGVDFNENEIYYRSSTEEEVVIFDGEITSVSTPTAEEKEQIGWSGLPDLSMIRVPYFSNIGFELYVKAKSSGDLVEFVTSDASVIETGMRQDGYSYIKHIGAGECTIGFKINGKLVAQTTTTF